MATEEQVAAHLNPEAREVYLWAKRQGSGGDRTIMALQIDELVAEIERPRVVSRISEERLRNTRAWADARVGQLSGAEVIVSAIDELLEFRQRDERKKA